VLVRLERITGVDLNVFDFDYDLTFFAFFMNADGRVYGRYGGRDASSPEKYLSLDGLRFAMQSALEAHKRAASEKPPAPPAKKLLVEEYPAATRRNPRECIHCHQVFEFRRDEEKSTGRFQRDALWVYPLPQNIGVTLDVKKGNRVAAVASGSPADRAGLQPDDVLKSINGIGIASFADVQYGLHRAPAKGEIAAVWLRAGQEQTGKLALAEGWRKTNPTWRPSMLDILPSLPLSGDDLSVAEKKALGLSEKRLAFRQADIVHKHAQEAGVKAGDVYVGFNGNLPEMTMEEFLGTIRRNYLVGDKITLNVLRNGKRMDLPMTLR
jgi:hypothetical protein